MKIYRSQSSRVIAGVCGGIAEHLGWSPFRLRLIWVLATPLTAGINVLLYLALCYLMPKAAPPFEPTALQPWKSSSARTGAEALLPREHHV